jgi:hypothetical protein
MTNLVDEVIDERRRSGGESRDLLGLRLTEGHPMTGERLDPVNIRVHAAASRPHSLGGRE